MSDLNEKLHDRIVSVEWSSGVSETRKDYPPFLNLRVEAEDGHVCVGQLKLSDAQKIMRDLLHTIEAADMDSALMRFAITVLKMNEEQAGYMVAHLRSFRESSKDEPDV